MDTNKTFYFVYLWLFFLLAFDFGAMPHCVPSEVFYSRAFVVKNRPFVVKKFGLFLTNRCLALSSL